MRGFMQTRRDQIDFGLTIADCGLWIVETEKQNLEAVPPSKGARGMLSNVDYGKRKLKYINMKRHIFILIIFLNCTLVAESQYLHRSLSSVREVHNEFTSTDAYYKPLFGAGDDSSAIIRGAARYGYLVVEPGGRSGTARYDGEESVLFVIEGTGNLYYGNESIPVSKNDFIYIPGEMKFGLSNPREQSLAAIVMGFKLSPDTCPKSKSGFKIANTDEVRFQTLPGHGPTTMFQLLMGTIESKRDRLAAACKVTSLFIMDFASGGTNNPHKHDTEEEIYLILKGRGDMVAGETADGKDLRHPAEEGDAYFFSPGTKIGFYSGNTSEEEHAQILAVRFKYH
jgi:mannose-6-phosphate isomerase-like protein (cupin superfamily)